METRETRLQKAINTCVSIICVIALMLICSEPAEGTSFNDWFIWEIVWMAVFAGCGIYLNKHLPDDENKA